MTSSPDPSGWLRRVRKALRLHEDTRTALPAPAPPTRDAAPTVLEDNFFLAKRAVEQGLLRTEDLERCLSEKRAALGKADEPSLEELLFKIPGFSREAWERLRNESARSAASGWIGRRYELKDLLGEGAVAFVYRAWDHQLGRSVAVKVLREATLLHEIARERFRREARAAASIAHPNVVTVFDAGEDEGRLYLVMEIVDGQSLGEYLKGRTTEAALLETMEKVARGVAAAHEKGIVHRDLKPANVLVTRLGEPKVGDFGLAHYADPKMNLTRAGATLGTPLYMAPEQVRGRVEEITPATDVYALGAILYEAATGKTPHVAETLAEMYSKVVEEDIVPPRRLNPRMSRSLETILLKTLEKNPARRYATARELALDLARCREGEPIDARPPALPALLYSRLRKSRRTLAVLGVTVAAGLAVVAVSARLSETRRADRERDVALEAIRKQAEVSVDAAMRLRRAGDLKGARELLPPLEAAYREAVARAPKLAEVDYLLGRMHRVLMEHHKALDFQNLALEKDPAYAPSLYERIILLSKLWGAFIIARGAGGELENVFEIPENLKQEILRDSGTLEALLNERAPAIGEARLDVAQGILALHRGSFAESRAHFERAIGRDPTLEEAWENLAKLQENVKGPGKPIDALHRVAEILDRALSHDQGYIPYWEDLSFVRSWEAVTRHNAGEDPLALFAEAEACTDRILKLDPESVSGRTRRGSIHFERAVYVSRRGGDPVAEFEAAERDFGEALRLRPESAEAVLGRIRSRVFRMIHRVKAGGDPAEDIPAVEADLARARTLPKALKEVALWQGVVETERAVHARAQGRDAGPHLAAAERLFSEGLAKNPADTSLWLWRGIVKFERGRYRAGRGEDPLPEYALAVKDFDERIRLSGTWPEVWTRRGLTNLYAARYKASVGKDPLEAFTVAEQDFSKALDLNKHHAEAWAGRGTLKLHRGLFESAVDDFEQALRINPNLDPETRESVALARAKRDAARKQ